MSSSDDNLCTCGHARWPYHVGRDNENGRCTLGSCPCTAFESAADAALLASMHPLREEFDLLTLDHRLPDLVALASAPLPCDPGTLFPWRQRKLPGFSIDIKRREVRDPDGALVAGGFELWRGAEWIRRHASS